jgi:uncharacterized protein YbjT (DUF2867 family)
MKERTAVGDHREDERDHHFSSDSLVPGQPRFKLLILLADRLLMTDTHPILVTGAAGGAQGSTGRRIASRLLEQGIPVRALVHKLDSRSGELRQLSAEVVEGDLLNSASVQAAMRSVRRAYFTYPVTDGLFEATTTFAAAARDAALELVVNNSQYQGAPGGPAFRGLTRAASFRNLQHRLAERIFDRAQVGAVHLQAPPYYENVRALVSRSVAESGEFGADGAR